MEKKSVFIILGTLVGLNILAWSAVYELSKGAELLEVTFFDVGQGDAIFIETPQRHQILIDGGPDSAVLEKMGKEMPFWDRTIDLIVLTHPERDHMSGLLEVLKRYKVENILWTGVLRDTAEYKEWQRLIQKEGAKIYIAQAGQRIEGGEISFDILYPFDSLEGQEFKDSNDTSIIAKLIFNETSFLFTGDATMKVEKRLINEGEDIDSDVLKVGHHGSKTSSAGEFIQAVSPGTAVISVGGDNNYGHPYPETLAILEKYGIKILRTDLIGDIKIISDGINFIIQ
ncbi:MAG: ComEC/Rec2 family competence protein [Candidatus Nealsonbacteria bacterium]|nr:ComEC/Rec2 family competence protein [Candidatus Nealsonbacteria bacterium]